MMPKFTTGLGSAFIILGLLSYCGTGAESVTALIPAFFGVVFVILGMVALAGEGARKHSMHAAAGLALVGMFGSFAGVIDVFAAMGGAALERPMASYAQAIMAVGLIIYLVLAIKSFRDARKAMAESG